MFAKIASMAIGSIFKSYVFWLVMFIVVGAVFSTGAVVGYKYSEGRKAKAILHVYKEEIEAHVEREKKVAIQDKKDVIKERKIRETGQIQTRSLRGAAARDPNLGGRYAGDSLMQAWINANKGDQTSGGSSK